MRQVLLRCVLITDSFYVVFLLINVKMQTIVGILTFMNGKNSTLGLSEQKKKKIKALQALHDAPPLR